MFKKYPKIHRLGKEETDGILTGTCYVEEKIDGANTSIWIEDGEIKTASRSQIVTSGFNGFVDYVRSNQNINNLLKDNPTFRLYGEWLVRHTIAYNELAYKKFYLFDIEDNGVRLDTNKVHEYADKYGIPHPQLFGMFTNATPDQINVFAGKTNLGEKGEGIVVKNPTFINKFGELQYAKIVTQEFKEDNGVVFGGNNKHSETYWETWVTNKYMTLERIQKIINKLQPIIDKKLDLEHTPRVANTAFHDMLVEEIWDISKHVQDINMQSLKRIAIKKAIMIYKEIITGDISVAHKNNV